MKHLLLLIFFLITVISAQTESSCVTRIKYKKWFIHQPENTVVGFPSIYKSSVEDGYDRFCGYNEMRAKGVVRFYEVNGKVINTQDKLNFYYDPNHSHHPMNDLIAIDSFSVTKGNVITIYSLDSNTIVDSEFVYICSDNWNKNSELSSKIYGYGIAKLGYYDHLTSWIKAESDAVRDLLGKSSVLVASIAKSDMQQSVTETFRYEYDLIVDNITVEKRWVSKEDGICHVVVSANRSAISEDTSKVVINEDTKTKNTTKVEENEIIVSEDSGINDDDISSDTVTNEEPPQENATNNRSGFTLGSKEWFEQYEESLRRYK